MNMVMNFVLALQILTALVMIGLVLIQHGKGADMGASFGSGASGSLFGATGSANFLSRSTAVCAAVFFVCTLALAYFVERPTEGELRKHPRPACRERFGCRIGAGHGRSGHPSGAGSAPASLSARRRLRRPPLRRLGRSPPRAPGDPAEIGSPRLEFTVARRAIPHASRSSESSAADVVKLVDTLS